jgi:hypothetical protein
MPTPRALMASGRRAFGLRRNLTMRRLSHFGTIVIATSTAHGNLGVQLTQFFCGSMFL